MTRFLLTAIIVLFGAWWFRLYTYDTHDQQGIDKTIHDILLYLIGSLTLGSFTWLGRLISRDWMERPVEQSIKSIFSDYATCLFGMVIQSHRLEDGVFRLKEYGADSVSRGMYRRQSSIPYLNDIVRHTTEVAALHNFKLNFERNSEAIRKFDKTNDPELDNALNRVKYSLTNVPTGVINETTILAMSKNEIDTALHYLSMAMVELEKVCRSNWFIQRSTMNREIKFRWGALHKMSSLMTIELSSNKDRITLAELKEQLANGQWSKKFPP